MRKRRRLQDAYRFPGFQPLATVRGVFGDPQVRIVQLVRRRKKDVCVWKPIGRSTISGPGWCANGDAGHVINLQPRSGDPLAHPLRSVTIDQTTGLFCTMRFDAPASADIGYSSIAHVTLNMAEIKGYYLVQNELIDMVATAPRSLDYRIRATIVFDAFTGLKP